MLVVGSLASEFLGWTWNTHVGHWNSYVGIPMSNMGFFIVAQIFAKFNDF